MDNTAPAGSVPLILALHGTADDPLMYVDEIGLLEVAGQEGLAVVAPFEEEIVVVHEGARAVMGVPIYEGVNTKALPALIDYMLEKYPALDATRLYATGYSMGGAVTVQAVECAPQLFAAAVPMAAGTPWGIYTPAAEEAAAFANYDVAMMFTTSEFDLPSAIDAQNKTLGQGYQECIKRFADFNELGDFTYNFAAYPFVGFATNKIVKVLLNGEYENTTWYVNNQENIPMLAVNYTELLPHGLHPDYGVLAWNFMKQYSRDMETGKLIYTP